MLELLGGFGTKLAMKEQLGEHYNWALIGMQEAVQRAQFMGNFVWLRVYPWLGQHNEMPPDKQERVYKMDEITKRDAEFQSAAAMLMAAADETLARAMSEQAAIEAAAAAATVAGEDFQATRAVGFKLASLWLTGLVVNCPSIERMTLTLTLNR